MLLAKTTVSNAASFDWALPPGFARYRIEVQNYQPATDQQDIGLQVSTDGGSNFATSGYLNASLFALAGSHGSSGGTTSMMMLGVVGQSNTYSPQSLIATLYNAEAGQYPRLLGYGEGQNNLNQIVLVTGSAEYNASTDRVTHIRLLPLGGGNITSGEFRLYGEA